MRAAASPSGSQPKLGLDLIGGTQATYQASLMNGQVPPQASMEEARRIIESRVNALGVSEAEVVIEGNRNIVVSLAGEADDQLKNVGQAAQMRFRKVLQATGDVAATAINPPSAAPSANPSAPAGQAPAVTGSSAPAVAPSSGGQGGGGPIAAPAPSGAPSAEPRPGAVRVGSGRGGAHRRREGSCSPRSRRRSAPPSGPRPAS